MISPDEALRLMQTYGPCHVCGAPRMRHTFTETHYETGHEHTWTRIVCTQDWHHSITRDDEDELLHTEPRS